LPKYAPTALEWADQGTLYGLPAAPVDVGAALQQRPVQRSWAEESSRAQSRQRLDWARLEEAAVKIAK